MAKWTVWARDWLAKCEWRGERGGGGGGQIKGGSNMVADWGLANSWRKARVAN